MGSWSITPEPPGMEPGLRIAAEQPAVRVSCCPAGKERSHRRQSPSATAPTVATNSWGSCQAATEQELPSRKRSPGGALSWENQANKSNTELKAVIPASAGWGQDTGSANSRSQGVPDASHARSRVWRLPVLLWATPNPWVTPRHHQLGSQGLSAARSVISGQQLGRGAKAMVRPRSAARALQSRHPHAR